ncbi:hypothetical protein ACFVT1_16545 [Streptomyces sp. NPDC057963]|uniref:hypothetical protein n=1 Tax=Streptomyces sp. NPDC057963 TaxID=3346290 RepID=UPI0036EEDC15
MTEQTNLRTDRAMNPEDYGPGEYEAARDRIRQQQSVNTAAMERAAAVESTPHRADYAPVVMELVGIWEDAHDSEKNALLRQLVRRVALVRTDSEAAIEVHPVWEPDPWVEAEAEATE